MLFVFVLVVAAVFVPFAAGGCVVAFVIGVFSVVIRPGTRN